MSNTETPGPKAGGSCLFPVKAVSADELPNQTGGRDLIVHIGFQNIVQELDHSTNLVILLILRLDCGQQRVNMLFQHRQFIDGGAVDDHVGVLLEGEDPPPLPPLNTVPHG